MSRSIWQRLGISQTRDRAEIRRAYAKLLKATHPEDDPDGFKALREAYERALAYADSGTSYIVDLPYDPDDDGDDEDLYETDEADDGGLADARPEPWPDQDLASQLDEHAFAFRTLYGLVEHRAPKDEVANAVAALLTTPQIGEVDVHNATEWRLAELITQSAPYADGVLEPAATYFRWRERSRAFNLDYRVRSALAREDDLRFLVRARSPGGWEHTAWRTLSRRPGGWRTMGAIVFGRAGADVRKMLNVIDQERFSLEADFDEATLAWWRERMSRPLFPGFVWPWAMAAAFIGALIGYTAAGGGLAAMAGGGVAGFLTLLIPALIKAYWIDNPAHPPSDGLDDRIWRQMGWVPASFLLLAVAGVTPPSIILVVGCVAAALGLMIWSWKSSVLPRDIGDHSWLTLLVFHLALPIWIGIQYDPLDPLRFWQLWLVVLLLIGVFARGGAFLTETWFSRLLRTTRLFALAGIVAALTVSAAFLILGAGRPELARATIVCVTAASLFTGVTVSYLPAVVNVVRHYIMWFGALALIGGLQSSERSLAILFGGWLLIGGNLVPALAGLIQETSAARDRNRA